MEEVWNWELEMELEKAATLAERLDIVRDPAGFVIIVEPRVKDVAVGALIVVYTVRLLVTTEFEAFTLRVLMLGTVIESEKRRSFPR
jgi:hypothetical protein